MNNINVESVEKSRGNPETSQEDTTKEKKAPKGTFTQVPNVLLDTCELADEAITLFIRLIRQVGYTGRIFQGSIRKMASTLNIKKDKAHRNLKVLEDAGLVSTGIDESIGVHAVRLYMDELWELNIAYHEGIEIPTWSNLAKALEPVRKLRQEQQEEAEKLSQKRDNSVANTRQHVSNMRQNVAKTGQFVASSERKVPPKKDKITNNIQEEGKNAPDTSTGEKPSSLIPSGEQQKFIDRFRTFLVLPDAINEKFLGHIDRLREEIHSEEDIQSLMKFAGARIQGPDKTVYPGNMASSLNAWKQSRKQQQTVQPSQPTTNRASGSPSGNDYNPFTDPQAKAIRDAKLATLLTEYRQNQTPVTKH